MNGRYTNIQKYTGFMVFLLVFAAAFIASSSFEAFALSTDTVQRVQFNKTIAYVITTTISFLLLLGYCFIIKEKEVLFILLFVSVFVVNAGYAFLSASKTLEEALLANKISYMGAVFLPLIMVLIVFDECKYKRNRFCIGVLVAVTAAVFFLTMTPGYTTWYYESVELTFVNGGAKLLKTYGPLHKLYYLYLFLYFFIMIAAAVWAIVKRKSFTRRIPLSLLFLMFGNILVWYIEQRIYFEFEFLSISYIVTEMYLLSLYNVVHQYDANRAVVMQTIAEQPAKAVNEGFDSGYVPDMQDIIKAWPQVAQLTTREVEVFKELILNKKRREIAEELCVSENTVKKHTTNIFTKLGVSSRTEIMNMLLKIK